MKKKYLIYILFLFFAKSSFAQLQLSVYSEVSIITAGPGTELYEAFGHSALRIKDPVLQLDLIYNYGMFDFNAPNFYSNFTKGKLIYKLGRYRFDYFLRGYNTDKRWIKEQVLNLTRDEKQAFFTYLEKNAAPQNASYFYDPYFNNCATKLRDITQEVLGDKISWNDEDIEANLSFRQLMNREIPWNTWGSFGINLALGSKLDQKADFKEFMYLPDYVYLIFKNSTVKLNNENTSLVKKENTILQYDELEQSTSLLSPFLIFSLLSLLGLFITFKDYKNRVRTKVLDFILLFVTGIIGVLIVFLWFFTDHSTTPNNFNVLWAFAPNLILGFLLLKQRNSAWFHKYFIVLVGFLILIPMIWISGIQLFPTSIIPLLILFFVRYLYLVTYFKPKS
ncbi:lipoprotein N-acyltransferase Lnb domain-containing protein [Polaribacter sp. P097]|uniref:lipoprotein N-acyltransferase Lnb domain-containing protein n=1 Tax=Polaribacter sp. P097 TaxID=3117398 RepID=UPI002FE3F1DE